jgi:Galactose oxidase, central domain/Kelch motif
MTARPSTFPDPRVGETATRLPDGRVLIAGGESLPGRPLSSAEIYDPRRATWTPTRSMHVPRWHHTATLLLDGTVVVAGGTRAGDHVSSPETFDPRTGKWTLVAPARARR